MFYICDITCHWRPELCWTI